MDKMVVNMIETNLHDIGKKIRIEMWPILTTNVDKNFDQFILDICRKILMIVH